MAAGFYPYRSGIQGNFQAHQSETYRSLAQRLKTALDPNGHPRPGPLRSTILCRSRRIAAVTPVQNSL